MPVYLFRVVFICLSGVGFLLYSCSEPAHSGNHTFHSAVEYNDFIVDQQNAIIRRMLKLNALYDQGSAPEIRLQFDSLVLQSTQCLQEIQNLTPFEDDSLLKQEALKLFGFYDQIFHHEYKRMLDIFLKGEEATDAEVEELNAIVDRVGAQEAELQESLGKTQQQFSQKHGFEFEANLQ